MKKSSFIITILLFISIVILYISITNSKDININTNYKNINFKDNQLLAVAYLKDISEITSTYNNIVNNVNVIDYEDNELDGEELYLIIPRYEMDINIYTAILDENTAKLIKDKLLKQTDKPFVIKCNVSDIMSNIIIEFNYKNNSYEYSPSLSLKDGKLNSNDRILDITKYE